MASSASWMALNLFGLLAGHTEGPNDFGNKITLERTIIVYNLYEISKEEISDFGVI